MDRGTHVRTLCMTVYLQRKKRDTLKPKLNQRTKLSSEAKGSIHQYARLEELFFRLWPIIHYHHSVPFTKGLSFKNDFLSKRLSFSTILSSFPLSYW